MRGRSPIDDRWKKKIRAARPVSGEAADSRRWMRRAAPPVIDEGHGSRVAGGTRDYPAFALAGTCGAGFAAALNGARFSGAAHTLFILSEPARRFTERCSQLLDANFGQF